VAVILESVNCETGCATFWLEGREAFRVMAELLPGVVPTRIDAGIFVTIHPEALTDEAGSTNFPGTCGDAEHEPGDELDLFALRLENPEDERC